jgi:hypothetical protein
MMASTLLDMRLTRFRLSAVLVVSLVLICLTSFPTATASGHTVTFAAPTIGYDAPGQPLVSLTPTGGSCIGGPIPLTGGSVVCSDGTSLAFSFTDPVAATPGSGKQYKFVSADQISPLTVSDDITVTGTYVIQWQQTFDTSANVVDATGTVVTVNGVPVSAGSMPYSVWVDEGSSVTYSYEGTVLSTVSGKRYSLTTPAPSPTSGYTVDGTTLGAVTVTGTYKIQFEVSFAQVGLDVDATATDVVVTIDSVPKTVADLPVSLAWLDEGIVYSAYSDVVTSSVSGKQFKLTGVTGPASPIAGPGDVVGTYRTEFLLTIATGGLGSYTTEVYLGGVDVGSASDSSPFTHWFKASAGTGTIRVDDPVSGATGTQYVFALWDPDDSTDNPRASETMNAPKTFQANFHTQYQLTMATNFGTTNPSVGAHWYGEGTILTITATSPTAGAGEQYVFLSGWTGSGTGGYYTGTDNPADSKVTMSGPVTETASWTHQYQVTFASSGIGSDTTGTVVTVNTHAKTQASLSYTAWYDSGSPINYVYSDPVPAGTGKRYVWVSTSGLGQSGKSGTFTPTGTGTGTVTGTYKTQYYLTVTSAHGGSPSGQGWYDSGTYVSSSVISPVTGGTGKQYACTGWTGTNSAPHSGTGTGTGAFQITAPSSVTWNWKTQYSISFSSSGIGTDTGPATIVSVNGLNLRWSQLPYTAWYDLDSTIGYTFYTPVSASPGRQYAWTSTSGSLGYIDRTKSFTVSTGGTVIGAYTTGTMAEIETPIIVDPGSSAQGSSVTFTVTVRNTGTNNMASVQVKLSILKPDGSFAASLVGVISNFVAGSEKTVQVSYTTALTAPIGTWHYNVEVYYGTTRLSSLADWTFGVVPRILTGTIALVAPPASVSRGSTATFTVKVKNTGNVRWPSGLIPSGTVTIRIFNHSGVLVANLYLTIPATLQPSSENNYNLSWLVPRTIPTGSYTYTAYLYCGTTPLAQTPGTITVN